MENRPKIGLALSGASGRAITHIGVLEALQEHGISIDVVTAVSSGTLIAASSACGTVERLKADWLRLNRRFLLEHLAIDKSGRGVFSLEKFAEWFAQYTLGKRFEEVRPVLGFVCVDILRSEPVTLSLGDLVHAAQASCAVPGLFEPVQWGNKLLVDGGLFSIIPTSQAKEMGAEIVIGVDIASTRYMFSQKYLRVWKGYNFLRRTWPVRIYAKIHEFIDRAFTKSVDFIYYNQSDLLEESGMRDPGMFAILGKALDISIRQHEDRQDFIRDCDYLISPDVKQRGKIDLASAAAMLAEGRRAAEAAIPDIKRLIRDYESKQRLKVSVKKGVLVS